MREANVLFKYNNNNNNNNNNNYYYYYYYYYYHYYYFVEGGFKKIHFQSRIGKSLCLKTGTRIQIEKAKSVINSYT